MPENGSKSGAICKKSVFRLIQGGRGRGHPEIFRNPLIAACVRRFRLFRNTKKENPHGISNPPKTPQSTLVFDCFENNFSASIIIIDFFERSIIKILPIENSFPRNRTQAGAASWIRRPPASRTLRTGEEKERIAFSAPRAAPRAEFGAIYENCIFVFPVPSRPRIP